MSAHPAALGSSNAPGPTAISSINAHASATAAGAAVNASHATTQAQPGPPPAAAPATNPAQIQGHPAVQAGPRLPRGGTPLSAAALNQIGANYPANVQAALQRAVHDRGVLVYTKRDGARAYVWYRYSLSKYGFETFAGTIMTIGDTLRVRMARYNGPLGNHDMSGTVANLTYIRRIHARRFQFSLQLPTLPNSAPTAPITLFTGTVGPILATLAQHDFTMERENRFSETVHLFRQGLDYGSIDECKIMAKTVNYP